MKRVNLTLEHRGDRRTVQYEKKQIEPVKGAKYWRVQVIIITYPCFGLFGAFTSRYDLDICGDAVSLYDTEEPRIPLFTTKFEEDADDFIKMVKSVKKH